MMSDRDNICARAKLSKKDQDYNIYKFWRNIVTDKLRDEKKHFFDNEINKNIKNPKKMWGELNKALGNNKNSPNIPYPILVILMLLIKVS